MIDPDLKSFNKVTIVSPTGELSVNAGRYTRGAVLAAYQMIGGLETLATWADDNQGEFFTKMFAKVIGREVEIGVADSVEALLDKLDNNILENSIIDGEFEDVSLGTMPEKREALRNAALIYAAQEAPSEAG